MDIPVINMTEIPTANNPGSAPVGPTAAEVANARQAEQTANAANGGSPAPSGGQTTGCTGDCRRCNPYQRAYCSAQIGYNTQNLLASLSNRIEEIAGAVAELCQVCGMLYNEIGRLKKPVEEPTLFEPETIQPAPAKKRKGKQA